MLNKKIIVYSILIIITLFAIYIVQWSFMDGKINSIKIITYCSTEKVNVDGFPDKPQYMPTFFTCFIRDKYIKKTLVKESSDRKHFSTLEKIIAFSKSCYSSFILDKKNQLICLKIHVNTLDWLLTLDFNKKVKKNLRDVILKLEKQIKYNINNPWEKLIPELKENSRDDFLNDIKWLESILNHSVWNLSIEDISLILGLDLNNVKSVDGIRKYIIHNNDKELITRLNLLHGIYDVLAKRNAEKWFITKQNDQYFKNESPKELLSKIYRVKKTKSLIFYTVRLATEKHKNNVGHAPSKKQPVIRKNIDAH